MAESGVLADRAAVVVGATGGIGAAVTRAYAAAGASLLLIARDKERLATLAGDLPEPERVLVHPADVTDPDSLADAAAAARDRWGTVSALCIASGTMRTGSVDAVSVDGWHELVATNITGPVLAMRAFLPVLADPSSVVLIASTAGLRAVPDFAAYTTTKAAIIHLSQACALDWASRGVRVNCVCPGVVESPIHDGPDWPPPEMLYDAMTAATPVGYLGKPTDVARAVLFLSDPKAHWMTGSVLVVDGGLSLV